MAPKEKIIEAYKKSGSVGSIYEFARGYEAAEKDHKIEKEWYKSVAEDAADQFRETQKLDDNDVIVKFIAFVLIIVIPWLIFSWLTALICNAVTASVLGFLFIYGAGEYNRRYDENEN